MWAACLSKAKRGRRTKRGRGGAGSNNSRKSKAYINNMELRGAMRTRAYFPFSQDSGNELLIRRWQRQGAQLGWRPPCPLLPP